MRRLSDLGPQSRAVLLAFGLLAAGLLFRQLVSLLIAVLILILIAIPLSAAATRLERRRVPRVVGVLLALLFGLAVIAGIFALIIPPFVDQTQQFVDELPATADTMQQKVGDVLGIAPSEVGDSAQEFLQSYVDDPGTLIGPITSIGLNVAGLLAALLLIIVTAAYVAVEPRPLVDGALSLFPPDRRGWAEQVMSRLRRAWIGWMQGVLVDMLVTGILFYLGLTLIGLDFAVVFAVFSALLVVIPYFGAIAAGIPPVLFALTDSPGTALLVLAIYIGVQQFQSNVTIPLVMAQRVKLHPAVVAVGVVIVGQLFGIIGLFVAVPILSLIVILTDELWVRPLEGAQGLERVDSGDLASRELDLPERPPQGTHLPGPR